MVDCATVSTFELSGCTALVTGASSGIGRALALALAREGVSLIITARRADRLEELAREIAAAGHPAPAIVPGDLAADGGPEQVFAAASGAAQRPIDILVNNAGFGQVGAFGESDPDRIAEMLRLNIDALVRLTRLALPDMIARRKGAILQVASTAAFVPLPYSATYAATKAFVVSFSEAVHAEVAEHGVHMVCLCPGRTDTEFFAAAGYDPAAMSARGADWMTAEAVAEEGIRALRSGSALRPAGVLNRLFVALAHLVPRGVLRGGAARVMRQRRRAMTKAGRKGDKMST